MWSAHRKEPDIQNERSTMIALVTVTLNKTHLYLLSYKMWLIYLNQNKIIIVTLDKHTLFYMDDMYSKELNNTTIIRVLPQC